MVTVAWKYIHALKEECDQIERGKITKDDLEQEAALEEAERLRGNDPSQMDADEVLKLPWFPEYDGSDGAFVGGASVLHQLLDDPETSKLGTVISLVLVIAILSSVLVFCMGTMPNYLERPTLADCEADETFCEPQPLLALQRTEYVCIVIFTVEYLSKCLTAFSLPRWDMKQTLRKGKPRYRVRTRNFITDPMNVIDLLAIMPFYVVFLTPATGGVNLSFLRILRLVRVFRVFRFGNMMEIVHLFVNSIKASTGALNLLIFLLVIGMILFSSMLVFCEQSGYDAIDKHYLRPEKYHVEEVSTHFRNIPFAFWYVPSFLRFLPSFLDVHGILH
jgi:hypothetical protein